VVGCFIGGLILVTVADESVRFWQAKRRPPRWQEWHMSRMVGSYLSVVTGFVVQAGAPLLVAVGMPASWLWVSWFVPSLVGVPLWALWRARLRRTTTPRRERLLQRAGRERDGAARCSA
jgi:sterol desaturase/sphingolipid hydroxylase (fatty acid hydroxylase superfamily)